MKKKALLFITLALFMLAIVPTINLISIAAQKKADVKWWKRSALYNLDFTLPTLSRLCYRFGISLNPDVIIGTDDWLYLGDMDEGALSTMRHPATPKDLETAQKIKLAAQTWDDWLKKKGVRCYKIMVGPNKGTIYPENLPKWVKPTNGTIIDLILSNPGHYVDTRSALRSAKNTFSQPLYYQSDTHWNTLGAWVAFRAFTKEISRTETDLAWLTDEQIRVVNSLERQGGDLTNFLRMSKMLVDTEVIVEIINEHPVETEQYDVETGQCIYSGGNPGIYVINRPLLVKSKGALNQKKVLWIRDSFGNAMSPFFAATFSETLQCHYELVDRDKISQLVEMYNPDYVFITVVERHMQEKFFSSLPPLTESTSASA